MAIYRPGNVSSSAKFSCVMAVEKKGLFISPYARGYIPYAKSLNSLGDVVKSTRNLSGEKQIFQHIMQR